MHFPLGFYHPHTSSFAALSLAINEHGLKEGLRCGIFLVAVFLVDDVPAVMLLKENRQFLQLWSDQADDDIQFDFVWNG